MSDPFAGLFEDGKRYNCEKGQLLVSPNEAPRGVFYIHYGYIRIYDISVEGEYQVIAISGPGDIFPLYWALGEEQRQLFYEAMCPMEFSILPKAEFKMQVENNVTLLKTALARVLKSYRHSQERIQNLELRTARERLAFRLLFLAKYLGHARGGELIIDVPITYQDLAESLNMTRETVNRVMRGFITGGLVRRSGTRLTIHKPKALVAILGTEISLNI